MVGLLEPFTHLHAQFARGKTLDPLTQARPVKTFPALRTDLDRLTHAGYLLSLWATCLPYREPAEQAFELLIRGLDAMQEPDQDPGLLCRWLELHFLDDLGYGPDFSRCHRCQQAVKAGWYSPGEGQLTCQDCGPSEQSRRISRKALSAFYHLRRMTIAELAQRKPDDALAQELEELLKAHLEHHGALKAVRVLHL